MSDVLKDSKERLDKARRERSKYEPDWYMNLAFFQGKQWVAWDTRGLYEPRVDRVKVTINQVQPIIRTEVAKMTKERPGWSATPRSADEQAVNDAVTSGRLMEWAYDALKFPQARRDAIEWSRLASAGFVKATWDPNCGGNEGVEVVVNAASKEPITNPDTGRVIKRGEFPEIEAMAEVSYQRIGQGDVYLDVRSPFDIYPDPLAKNLGECRWLIDESVRAPEYIKENYPDAGDVAPDAPSQSGIVESRTLATSGSSNGGDLQGVRVWEMWERSSRTNPDGRHVVWCDGHLLADEANPYDGLPYFMFEGIPVPGRFWPDSVATHLRSPQERLNKGFSQIAENASKFGNPSLLIDALADVKYYGVPGEQITYNGTTQTAVPSFLNPPQMPSYVFQLMDQFTQSLRDISGQYEVSNGTVPAGVTAASAISLLQEQDSTRLGPDIEAMEDTIGALGQHCLTLFAKYYSTDRITVIVGEDGVVDVDAFRASASFKVPDVKVKPFSTFPRSVAARQAAIRDTLNMLLQYGVPITAAGVARALRDMQVGGLENIVESFGADESQIAREHAQFLRGETIIGNALIDNHPAHIGGHKDFAKSNRFANKDDAEKQRLYDHIKWHMEQQVIPMDPSAIFNPGGAPAPPGAVPTAPSGNPMAATEGAPGGQIAAAPTI